MAKKETKAQFFMPGDKVLHKGIKLTVHEIRDDGTVLAVSPTMHVYGKPEEFTPFVESHN